MKKLVYSFPLQVKGLDAELFDCGNVFDRTINEQCFLWIKTIFQQHESNISLLGFRRSTSSERVTF